ncbi:MAG: pitrilysin family protein [Acidobacteriota bacterium]
MPLSDLSASLRRHTLPNGLRVVLHRDDRLPLVALNLWYHVGSKNEAPGETGFAHLFEHLLFQGSAHVDTNGHFHAVQQVGGSANGSTWFDRTNYYETLPAHHLERGLWLESDRMGFFLEAIDQRKLDTQRDVVINERRQRIDNQPYGRAFERMNEMLFPPGHPYRWPVIGSIPDLEAATLDTVRRFFRDFYAPNNAVLTLAGAFDNDEALTAIERWFGPIPSGPPIERPRVDDPTEPFERREVLPDDVPLVRLYLGHHAPPFGTESWYAGDLLAHVLAAGKTSPLYRDLVYDRRLAQDVGAFILPTELGGSFLIVATAKPGVEAERLEEALAEHLRRAAAEPPADDDLERARRRILTSLYGELESLGDRADHLSRFTTFFDRPADAFREAERYQTLDGEALRAFAAAHLADTKRAVLTVAPKPAAEAG